MDHLQMFSQSVARRNVAHAKESINFCKANIIAELMILILFTVTNVWPNLHAPSFIVGLVLSFNGILLAGNFLNWFMLLREINLWKHLL